MEMVEGGGAIGCIAATAGMVFTVGAAAAAGSVTGGWAVAAFITSFYSNGVAMGIECGEWMAGE